MPNPTVLVVDDSETVRQQVRMALEQADFEVVQAFNGRNGLEVIESNKDIAMVILDVNMPIMNGIEMIEELKHKGLIADLPVIMLTTEGNPALVKQAKQAGAKGWMVKPFNPEHLVQAAKKLTAA